MKKTELDVVLGMIAKQNGVSKETVRQEMQLAMEEGMRSTDPLIQYRWKQIPRKGDTPTLEEFLEYLLSKKKS